MFGLMKKDLPLSALQSTVMLTMLYAYWFATYDPINTVMTIVTGGYVFALITNLMLFNESQEDKYHGYDFMKSLPISIREIVIAKFTLPLLLTAFLVLFNGIALSFLPGSTESLASARIYVLVVGVLGLLCVGLGYVGAFTVGFTVSIKIALVVLMILVFSLPVVLMEWYLTDDDLTGFQTTVLEANWLYFVLAGMVVYAGLMVTSIRLQQARLTP
ncbi:MAG: hypothetical protein HOH43_04160 [Candidatus Latescibacteria bacterium]|jgi:ABC-2 type transport system permease protein|nr:hypothetical protein [Candidatus Latescibacterota bacterium]